MAARDDQGDQRERRLLDARGFRRLQPGRIEMALEVVDTDQRPVLREREALGEVDPHQERPRESRPVRDRDRVHVPPAGRGPGHRLLEHGHDPAQVRARSHFRHDATRGRMHRDLARHHVAVDRPTTLDHGDPRLVAAALDREQERAAHASASAVGPVVGSAVRVRSSARRRSTRCTIAGDSSGSVVMIRASSLSSL